MKNERMQASRGSGSSRKHAAMGAAGTIDFHG